VISALHRCANKIQRLTDQRDQNRLCVEGATVRSSLPVGCSALKPEKNRHPAGQRPELPSPRGRCLGKRASRTKEKPMKVSEIMTRDVFLASPGQKLREVASEMEKRDIGVLPVGDKDRLVGMITDRDIAVRGMSHGLGPDASVRDVMSAEVKYCFADDEIDDLAQNMAMEQIRRLPVLNDKKRLVGIVSLCDLATYRNGSATGVALSGISQHGGHHCQSSASM
jgi:CBS domain-containing protein